MRAAGYYAYQRSNQQEAQGDARTTRRTSTSYISRRTSNTSTPRRVLVNHDEDDDGNASTISQSSASSSSSSTILAPRPHASRQESSTVTSRPASVQRTHTATPATQTAPDEERRCWICFGEDADSEGNWVKPCKCSLVSHEQCLLDWITENQKGSPLKKVHCPQCNTPYYLTEQKSLPLALLTLVDSLVQTAAPYLTVLGLGCSVTLTSATYGVYTVLTLFGAREGQRLLGHPATWTYRTWIGLPCIPAALVLSRSRWADGVLPFAAMLLLRATYANQHPPIQMSWPPSPALTLGILPWVRLLYNNLYLLAQHHLSRKLILLRRGTQQQQQPTTPPRRTEAAPVAREEPPTAGDGTSLQAFREQLHRYNADILGDPLWETQWNERRRREDLEREEQAAQDRREREADALMNGREHSNLGVTVMGALLWPTISSIVGSFLDHFKLVRQYFPEPFHRNILGGCLFVVAKDLANLFYKYERIKQRQSRRIKNYNEVMQQ